MWKLGISAINLLFLVCCAYITLASFREYYRGGKGYTLYWGLAFALFGVSFAVVLASSFSNASLTTEARQFLAYSVHTMHSMAWWLLLYALTYIASRRFRVDPFFGKLVPAKVTHASAWIILTVLMIGPVLIAAFDTATTLSSQGLLALQVVGIQSLDLFVEVWHVIISTIIVLILARFHIYGITLWFGFMCLGMADVVQVSNIIGDAYSNQALLQIEWAIRSAGTLAICWDVKSISDITTAHINSRVYQVEGVKE